MKKTNQLKLDLEEQTQNRYLEPVQQREYKDLDVNERINVKANSCGFQKIYYTCNYTRYLRRDEVTTHLTCKWYWHHKVNNNRPWDARKVQPGKLF